MALSSMFAAMVRSIRTVNPDVRFFCVGDDWQAINGFAGADLRYFSEFGEPFRDTRVRAITTNYRSSVAVVQTGNALMHDDGLAANPRTEAPRGEALLCHLDTFTSRR